MVQADANERQQMAAVDRLAVMLHERYVALAPLLDLPPAPAVAWRDLSLSDRNLYRLKASQLIEKLGAGVMDKPDQLHRLLAFFGRRIASEYQAELLALAALKVAAAGPCQCLVCVARRKAEGAGGA